MKKMFIVALVLILSFAFSKQSLAQRPDSSFHFGLYLGASLPQGDYAASHGDKTGYAMNGIGAMFDFRTTFHKLTWASSLILSSNSVNSNAMQNQLTEMGVIADDHFTIWALTGLQYRKLFSKNFIMYGLGQFGLFHSNFPDIYVDDGDKKTTYTYSTSNTIGFAFGAGVSVFRMNLAVRYCIATPSYERSGDWLGKNGAKKLSIPSNNLFILLGYEF